MYVPTCLRCKTVLTCGEEKLELMTVFAANDTEENSVSGSKRLINFLAALMVSLKSF